MPYFHTAEKVSELVKLAQEGDSSAQRELEYIFDILKSTGSIDVELNSCSDSEVEQKEDGSVLIHHASLEQSLKIGLTVHFTLNHQPPNQSKLSFSSTQT